MTLGGKFAGFTECRKQFLYKHFIMSFKLSMTLHLTVVHTESHAAPHAYICVHVIYGNRDRRIQKGGIRNNTPIIIIKK